MAPKTTGSDVFEDSYRRHDEYPHNLMYRLPYSSSLMLAYKKRFRRLRKMPTLFSANINFTILDHGGRKTDGINPMVAEWLF
jgi:hypothetical protein